MMTKTERADILIDAIGFIGEDIIAESSGISNVLPIPSKLRLNLMLMRRLLAATLCLVLLTALTPISYYIYNYYEDLRAASTNLPDTTEIPDIEPETDPPKLNVKPIIDSMPSYGNQTIRDLFHEDYIIQNGALLQTQSFGVSDNGSTLFRSFCSARLTERETREEYLYIDFRNINDEIVNYRMWKGDAVLLTDRSAPTTFFVFNIYIKDIENYVCRAEYGFYNFIDGELTVDGERNGSIDINLKETAADEVDAFFAEMLGGFDGTGNWTFHYKTYLQNATAFYDPTDFVTHYPADKYWNLDYIKELYEYRFEYYNSETSQ